MAAATAPIYLTVGEAVALHDAILAQAGQASSQLRDRALLESALRRPQHAAFYEGADVIAQAALYMMGIAMNHPFVDGNKRAGFAAGVTFLHLNGYAGAADRLNDVAPGQWLEQVVAHALSPDELIERLRARLA